MGKQPGRRSTMLRAAGLILAVIGIVGQLSAGRLALRADDAAAIVTALASVSVDCHPASPAPGNRAPHRHHETGPSLCPTQPPVGQPSVAIAPPVEPPDAATMVVLRSALPPPSRGPPPPTARVGEPRAPPVQT